VSVWGRAPKKPQKKKKKKKNLKKFKKNYVINYGDSVIIMIKVSARDQQTIRGKHNEQLSRKIQLCLNLILSLSLSLSLSNSV
jgi:glycerol-3-phosphate O-acyltransferase